jgi:uncharacterized membrane protein
MLPKSLRFIPVILILLASFAFAVSSNYIVVVASNGNAFVSLTLNGQGTINLPLPVDAENPLVSGALYVQTTNGIDVTVGSAGVATVNYQTAVLTGKQGDSWTFEMNLPSADSNTVMLLLPKDATIASTTPQGILADVENGKSISWTTTASSVKAVYSLGAGGAGQSTQPAADNSWLYVLGIIVVMAIIAFAFLFLKKKEGPEAEAEAVEGKEAGAFTLTKGMKNLIKTLSGNEQKIIGSLVDNNGETKRSKLEKTSGIAKSSLASALNQLERKNIVKVDRAYVTHYVRLTDWFKSL